MACDKEEHWGLHKARGTGETRSHSKRPQDAETILRSETDMTWVLLAFHMLTCAAPSEIP
ncbi:hypothetical protein N7492_009452 [Penicillium capsulatum]|uniref:Uncharacterized protein n=1 Tax=Penicillium capsulatum TaxID=69766 RepID=A0A9W9HX54_9EURO|nr:hypothetical protein N7492_009452 [Penicillium capsulatum]